MEENICKEVVQQIAHCLTEAKDYTLHCSKLLIPVQLLEHIGSELVQLASSEPCGLRGALVDVCVQQGETIQNAGQIAADPCVVPTFQLTLVLRPESGGIWPKIQGLFASKSSPAMRRVLKLSTGFRVIKRKLYSSEELLIEECWATKCVQHPSCWRMSLLVSDLGVVLTRRFKWHCCVMTFWLHFCMRHGRFSPHCTSVYA